MEKIGFSMQFDIHTFDQISINVAKDIITGICKEMNAKIVKTISHEFYPQGISMVSIISKSTISLHTWPEKNYVSIDIFSCSNLRSNEIANYIEKKINTQKLEYCIQYRK